MAAMSVSATHSASTLDWGRTHYVEAWKRQDELVAKRLTGEVCDTLVLTEHEPVFTIGLHQDAARHQQLMQQLQTITSRLTELENNARLVEAGK